ncbi:hypothetical protein K1719_046268 [Acacia pycnantha]|nr:hypothetical protein K1719_046268 [Acacia pycnantha]
MKLEHETAERPTSLSSRFWSIRAGEGQICYLSCKWLLLQENWFLRIEMGELFTVQTRLGFSSTFAPVSHRLFGLKRIPSSASDEKN